MRKALILIGILLLGGLAATTYAQTNDAPHNVTNSISCGDCHTLYPPGVYDDGMCTQCHDTILPPYSKMNAPMVATHSSDRGPSATAPVMWRVASTPAPRRGTSTMPCR